MRDSLSKHKRKIKPGAGPQNVFHDMFQSPSHKVSPNRLSNFHRRDTVINTFQIAFHLTFRIPLSDNNEYVLHFTLEKNEGPKRGMLREIRFCRPRSHIVKSPTISRHIKSKGQDRVRLQRQMWALSTVKMKPWE